MSRRRPADSQNPLKPLLLTVPIFVAAVVSSGYERRIPLISLESAAVAFCSVLASALVCAALDEFDVVGRPSPWVFWNTGVISWLVAKPVLTRLRT